MEELKTHLKTRWIKKYTRNLREIENLKYLITLNPKLIPSIKTITKKYYIIENYKKINPVDFDPLNFYNLYFNLLKSLYKFKRRSFTPGIYKYFAPSYSLSREIKKQCYIPYILNQLKKIIWNILIRFPELLNDATFVNLFKYLESNGKRLKKWKPPEGYRLLHGDLHMGNIVKRDNNFFLIDFEYLRYGAVELEISNLIISLLIWHYRSNPDNKKLTRLNIGYFEICNNLRFFDKNTFKFFFIFALILFHLSLYLKRDWIGLKAIQQITRISKIPKVKSINFLAE